MLERGRAACYRKVMEIILVPYSYNFENYINLITFPKIPERGKAHTVDSNDNKYFI